MLQSLLEVALLGTEKKAMDFTALPEEVRDYIHARHAEDKELQFLEAAALTHYYHLAGSGPELFTGAWNDEVIKETKSIAPDDLLRVFSKLEAIDYQWKETMLNLWMDVLIANAFIVSSELVTRIIQTGRNFSTASKSKIIQIIGSKGAWILAHSSELNYKQPVVSEQLWEEGVFQDRKTLFSNWRKSNPVLSIEKLQLTWSEESIANKKSFLEIIETTSVQSDLAFLEVLYKEEFSYRAKEKKTERDCRRIIAAILLTYPETELYKSTSEQLSSYFIKSKVGLLGRVSGKESVSFNLPEEEDTFWSSKTMEQVYGFEVKNIDIAVFTYPAQFWLSLFIEAMPLSFWSLPFDRNTNRLVNYFLDEDSFKTKVQDKTISILKPAFVAHVLTHTNQELAKAILQKLTTAEAIPLLQFLTVPDYEAFVEKYIYHGDVEVLNSGPFYGGDTWSVTFSRAVIKKAYELSLLSQAPPSLGQVMARLINRDVSNDLVLYHEKVRETPSYSLWNKNIFEPVFLSMEIRALIHSFKK